MRWQPLVVGVLGLLLARPADAAPVTWSASGLLDGVIDGFGVDLSPLAVGTPWSLEFTFDPATPGTQTAMCGGSSPTYRYAGAVGQTQLQLGGATYLNSGGDIFVNADLPVFGCQTPQGGPGLVQFQWIGGWTGGTGGIDLNLMSAPLLASYNDVQAVAGSLPIGPEWSAVQGVFGGLLWNLTGPQFYSNEFTPVADIGRSPAPVPEPATLLLVGIGAGLVASRARKMRRTPGSRVRHQSH